MSSPAKVLTNAQMVKLLKEAIGDKPVKKAAAAWGVSFQFLYHVLNGKYELGPKLAGILGYQQVTTFRRIPRAPSKSKTPRQAKA